METAQLPDVVERFPTTFAQQRIWFQEMAKPGNEELNIAVRWEIRGRFSASDIEAAMQLVTNRHEMLRTRFLVESGELWQEVIAKVRFRLGVVDLRAVAPDEHENRVVAMAHELAARSFDLTQPCLLRMTLVQLAPDRAALLIAAHHIAFDGFSIGVLGQEIGLIVQALSEGRRPDLPEIPVQYGDYALWEKEMDASGALEEDGAFWEERLKDAPYFELEPDFPRSERRTTTGKSIVKPFPADFDGRMTAFHRAAGVSFFTFGAAALSAALHRWSGKTDILFASPVAGRTDIETEKLIGIFINTLAMRIEVRPDATLAEHISLVSDMAKQSLLHQAYPFNHVVQRLKRPRDPSRTPVVSLNLNMQRVFLKERSYGAFEMVSVPSHMPGVLYDMNIQIIGRNAGWKLMIDYNDALFKPATVERFAGFLLDTFEVILSDPHRTLSSLQPAPGPVTDAANVVTAPGAASGPHEARAAPDAVRAKVQRIWADVLGIPVADCKGSFFDLGGHSLLALRMIARVEAHFGCPVQLSAFLADPTLASFARTVAAGLNGEATESAPAGDEARVWDVLVLRKASHDSPLIVTINQPFLYHALAGHLESDLEVVNLLVPDKDSFARCKGMTFDALAEDAAQILHSRYPGREMVLLGHCIDGVMALRTAQKLALANQTILAVAMTDTWVPGWFANMTGFRRVRTRWTKRLRRWGHYLVEKGRGRIGWKALLLKSRLGTQILRRTGAAEQQTEAELLAMDVNRQLVMASRDCTLAPYAGEVLLFKTGAQSGSALTETFGWSGILAADTPVYSLPGWHEDALLSSGVSHISKVLEARINRQRARSSDTAEGAATHDP